MSTGISTRLTTPNPKVRRAHSHRGIIKTYIVLGMEDKVAYRAALRADYDALKSLPKATQEKRFKELKAFMEDTKTDSQPTTIKRVKDGLDAIVEVVSTSLAASTRIIDFMLPRQRGSPLREIYSSSGFTPILEQTLSPVSSPRSLLAQMWQRRRWRQLLSCLNS